MSLLSNGAATSADSLKILQNRGLATSLGEVGIMADDIPLLADGREADKTPADNPVPVSRQNAVEIYECAL